MKKLLMIIIVFVMLFLLAACSKENVTTLPDDTILPQTDQTDVSSSVKAIVSIDYASEELLSKTDAFDKFVDDSSKYQVKVVFTSNIPVREFRYVELSFRDAGQGDNAINFDILKDLYHVDELTPQRPLVVTMLLDGVIPNRGISYVDESGTTRYFTISMSGKDNSLLLTEFH